SMRDIATTAVRLDSGASSRGIVEECISRIKESGGEGHRTFLKVHAEEALATATVYDRMRIKRAAPSRFAGIPVSIKDLFDVAGEVTTAGSTALRGAPPATRDAAAVARLRGAGF